MPSMQFSIPPWHYTSLTNVKVNEISKKFVDFHETVVYPVLKEFAQMATKNGSPIIRPLWWINSLDQNNLIIFDEFLVGDKFLVAPIVEKGAVQRNIYLPDGRWKDGNTGEIFTGPKWLYNHPAEIDIIPYFVSIISSHEQ
jgi:alpha-glucosidase (family GH31 glycosyl hydrolase)